MAELIKVTGKRGNINLIEIINKVHKENCNEEVENELISNFTKKQDRSLQDFALHIYAENAPVNKHNRSMSISIMDQLEKALVSIPATDNISKYVKLATNGLEGL